MLIYLFALNIIYYKIKVTKERFWLFRGGKFYLNRHGCNVAVIVIFEALPQTPQAFEKA